MKIKKYLMLCFCAAAALSTIAEARAQVSVTTKGGLVIADETLPIGRWEHGMVVQKFSVRNPAPRQRAVELSMLPGFNRSPWIGGAIEISANSSAVAELAQPNIEGLKSWQWAVNEDGVSQRQPFDIAKNISSGSSGDVKIPSLLISRSLSATDMNKVFANEVSNALVRGRSHSSSAPTGYELNINLARAEIEPAALPRHWLAYSPYDGVIVAAADYDRMPDEAKSALAAYAISGGTVALAGSGGLPAEWAQFMSSADHVKSADGAAWFSIGFGRLAIISDGDVALWSKELAKEMYKEFKRTQAPWEKKVSWRNTMDIDSLLDDIPGVGGAKTPVNAFLFLLFLFVLTAGPLAIVLLARRNQRIKLFWIVPLFSLVFSGVIFAAVSISEGFSSDIRRQAVTFLDQPNKRAATLGAIGMYTPQAPRGGLVFDNGTEVSPLLFDAPSSMQIKSGAKQIYTGFARPRMASFFRLRRVETRAERLIVEEKPDGSVEVVNALGAEITRLTLCDSSGAFHSGNGIAAGARVKLALSNATDGRYNKIAADFLGNVYSDSDRDDKPGWNYKNVVKGVLNVNAARKPREYIAELKGCPFIENPLRSAGTRESAEALVVGKY